MSNAATLRAPWQPGQSGFAGQQPKGLRRVLAMARKGSVEAVEVVLECMRDPNAPWPSRLAAATWIVERGWGKAKEHVSFEGAEGMQIVVLTGVPRPDEEAPPAADETTYTIEYEPGEEAGP